MAIVAGDPSQDVKMSGHCASKDLRMLEGSASDETTPDDLQTANMFRKVWRHVTDDNYLTLYGFRRFRTSHLLSLRFLEEEIDKIDHQIFQAGLKLGYPPGASDKLGLRYGKRDTGVQKAGEIVTQELLQELRGLLKQYDDGLLAFNNIMMMETFALADNNMQSSLRQDFNPYETYKTRLVRVDLAQRRDSRDVLRHSLRKLLRYFWFFVRQRGATDDMPDENCSETALEANLRRTYQNTTRLAEMITRFVVAMLAGAFLVVPLIVLSHQSSSETHLVTVSLCIVIFSLLVSLASKASNEQTMAASAGYAAVLVVFIANTSTSS